MLKKSIRYIVLQVLFISMCFCAYAHCSLFSLNHPKQFENKQAPGQITAFKIPEQIAPEVIDETNHLIGLVVHANTPVTALTPAISFIGANITPNSGVPQDFTNAVGYIIDGATFYSVNVLHARTPTPICNGTSTTIPGDPPPAIPGTFKWQILNQATGVWTTAAGANTNADYTTATLTSNANTSKLYTFRRSITNVFGTAYDSYNDLTVNPQKPIAGNRITAPLIAAFCISGDADLITGDPVTGGDGVNYSYQWQRSTNGGGVFTDIPGATSPDLDPPVANVTTIYQRLVSSGTCVPPAVSNRVTISILNAITNNQVYNPATIFYCVRATPSIINGNIPSGGTGTFHYQWQSSTDGINFTDIPGAGTTRQDYAHTSITVTTYYRRSAISGACTIPTYSNIIVITIQTGISNNSIFAPDCAGAGYVITGTSPAGGIGVYNYQWQGSPDGGIYTDIPGADAKNKDYTIPATTTATYYQRLVRSGTCELLSNQIRVTANSTLANNSITAPAITTFCVNGSPGIIPGSLPTGGGGAYTYVWQSSVSGGPFADIPGINVQNYDPQNLTQTTTYRRAVTSGTCNTPIYSNPVVITIDPPLANNILTAPQTTSFCQLGNADVIAGTLPTGGNGNYTFQWQQSPDNNAASFVNISGQTGVNLDPPDLDKTMFYRRIAMNITCSTPLISNVIEIHITPPVTANLITAANENYCESGNPAKIFGSPLQGGDGGNTYNYQWYSSTDNGSNWVPINGATGADYDPPEITATTWYRRDVISGSCQAPFASNIAKIIIGHSPAGITINPVAPVTAGSRVTFSILSPDPGLIYRWYDSPVRDNLLFTGPSYTTSPLASTQTFYAEALNSTCSSQVASITVTVTPQAGDIYVANAFTPNGDGKNDVVYVHNESIKSLKFYVYSQWGELLYASLSQQNGWDGTFKGKTEPAGVYVYYLEAIMNDGKQVNKKGTITLLR